MENVIGTPQVEEYGLTQLRSAAHLQVIDLTAQRLAKFSAAQAEAETPLPAKLQQSILALSTAHAAEDESYKVAQKSPKTAPIKDDDEQRDKMQNQLRQMVNMYAKADWEAEKQAAALQLKEVLDNYSVDVDENYLEESKKIQQQNQELLGSARLTKALQTIGAKALVDELETVNNRVTAAIEGRNDDRATPTEILAEKRRESDVAYRRAIVLLNAYAVVDDDAERYSTFILQLNEQISYFRQHFLPKKREKKEEGDTDPTPDPSPTREGSEDSEE